MDYVIAYKDRTHNNANEKVWVKQMNGLKEIESGTDRKRH